MSSQYGREGGGTLSPSRRAHSRAARSGDDGRRPHQNAIANRENPHATPRTCLAGMSTQVRLGSLRAWGDGQDDALKDDPTAKTIPHLDPGSAPSSAPDSNSNSDVGSKSSNDGGVDDGGGVLKQRASQGPAPLPPLIP